MRAFNSGAAAAMMNRSDIPDEMAIESKLVSRAIASAQSQLEARNAEIRKNVLKYDDVLSRQREAIYGDRRQILEGDDITPRIDAFLADVVETIVNQHAGDSSSDWNLEALWRDLQAVYPVGLEISEVLAEAGTRARLTKKFLVNELLSDARLAYSKRAATLGEDNMRELERRVVLSVIDRKWREHLYEMDYLKEGIGLRAMAQRDPLVEYQREGYVMFQQMTGAIREESIMYLFNLEVQVESAPVVEDLTYSAPSEEGTPEITHEHVERDENKGGHTPGSSFFKN
jgi:preprotein translocase subunit SecA